LLELIDKDQRGIRAVTLASTQNCLNWPVGLRVTVKFKACPADWARIFGCEFQA